MAVRLSDPLFRWGIAVLTTLAGALWVVTQGPFAAVRVTTPLPFATPTWYLLTAFPILGLLIGDLLFLAARHGFDRRSVELGIQILLLVVLSAARLTIRLPLSGHSLLFVYFIGRRLLIPPPVRSAAGGWEIALASMFLVAIGAMKIFWYDDPVSLILGGLAGAALAAVSRAASRPAAFSAPARVTIAVTLTLGGIAVTTLGGRAFWTEPASLQVRHHVLSVPRWPPAISGMRVAVLSDLHVGSPFNGLDKLERIIDATNSARPDLVLLPGDFVIHGVIGGDFVSPESLAPPLRRLSAPLGVWAVLGNHDWWLGARRITDALAGAGIRVLDDDAVRLAFGPEGFWLVGVSDYREGARDVDRALDAVPPGAPVLAFTHNPDIFPAIPPRVSLTVAGHTHGGQVHLPLLGRPVVPSEHGQRFAIGHIVEDGRHLFVSPGLGTSILPVRFRVPPEVTLLELRSE